MASGNGNVVLTKDIAEAREATAKDATNLVKAKADGYRIITKMIPDIGYHFLNPSIIGFNVLGLAGRLSSSLLSGVVMARWDASVHQAVYQGGAAAL